MKLYIAGRHRGKTTKLVEFARKHWCAIIVPSFNAANSLLRYMTHNYISNVPVFSIDEIISTSDDGSPLVKLRGRKIGGIVVDKDCYSLAKIREIEKAGFTVESVK